MLAEQIGYLKTVVSALSTRLVAVEAAAELGCAAHAVGIEMESWAVSEDLTVATYCILLDRAVERARRMMGGEECPSCAGDGLDPLLHNLSRRTRIGLFPSVHR